MSAMSGEDVHKSMWMDVIAFVVTPIDCLTGKEHRALVLRSDYACASE